jgi:glutathione S-transferase/GST-like protein
VSQPIDLYYWTTPNGKKISIALEEMGLAYTTHFVNINAGDQFKPDFLAISPNNRMPAIVDPDGPDGKPISIFESGAILQYLGRKTGKLYPADERGRVEVDQWLMWQMAGLGPMAGQAHHFRGYAAGFIKDQGQIAYGAIRYTNEVNRLYGVLNKQLEDRNYIAGDYSIADIACWPWTVSYAAQGIQIDDFPNVKAWRERIATRPAVIKGVALAPPTNAGADLKGTAAEAEKARAVLFGQRAR